MDSRPFIFVGSSSEGLPIAKPLQAGLADFADVTLWTQGIFEPSFGYLESLTKALEIADFAVLVLTKDDVTFTRGVEVNSLRDNVIFELGLFIGRLGRHRCFFVFEKSDPPKLPSDLLALQAPPTPNEVRQTSLQRWGLPAWRSRRARRTWACGREC